MLGKEENQYEVVIITYPGMTLLDAIGPNEVFANSQFFNVRFASNHGTDIFNEHNNLKLSNLTSIQKIDSADILLIPGGPGCVFLYDNEEVLNWIKKIDSTSKLTTSVCTGSLILAKTGLLNGKKACTHWAYLNDLHSFGARPKRKRFTKDGKYYTASGVSAGIDLALYITNKLISYKESKILQFGIEYFPNRFDILSSYTLPRFILDKAANLVKVASDQKKKTINR
jgi:putative intracellular protease/amidase